MLSLFASNISLAQQKENKVSSSTEATTPVKKKKIPLEINFSHKGGFYEDEVLLQLQSPGATIYYTTDGSPPSRKSKRYKRPIRLKKTAVIRAVARKGKRRSKIIGHSFFIDEAKTKFPTVSIAIAPEVLFDPEAGLFMQGSGAIDSIWSLPGANFWSKGETKINTEIFEANGKCEFNSITGFRLFGGMSRLFPQKSMTIVARDRYGKKKIRHKIFGKDGLKDFKFLVLRNSGSDWGKSHFRDAFMTGLLEDWDIEKQDYRPSHVYINGKYWGIYNIREKVNRYFIEDHVDVDKDSIDLIEHRMNLKRGSKRHYVNMLKFLSKNSLADPENYAYIQSQMDVDNFMNYQIAQIYFDNQDAGGNIKFWRPRTSNGKWRWILYDTDWGYGLHDKKAYKNNSLAFHTEPNGPAWPNPKWSTFILRKLLKNPDFTKEFINRFADHVNTTFETQRGLDLIGKLSRQLAPEIPRHLERWHLKKDKWEDHINRMKVFAKKRPDYVRLHLMDMFDTGDLVQINAQSSSGGYIMINNNIKVDTKSFEGKYFENIPIHIKAVPKFGYRFSHWEGVKLDSEIHDFTLQLNRKEYTFKAVFEKYDHPLAGQLMINEISANNKQSGDWVELFNSSEETVNLENWIFTDDKHEYKLPNIKIRPKSYVILCEDSVRFQREFPDVFNFLGEIGFGLNKRTEKLGLYSNDGAAIDSVSYELAPLDSVFSLGLLLPHLDNSDIENWEVILGNGSPHSANPYYLESRIKTEQELWMRIGIGIGLLLSCLFLLQFRKRKPTST